MFTQILPFFLAFIGVFTSINLQATDQDQPTIPLDAELIHAPFESDFICVKINGHIYWVIFAGHAQECPCGERRTY